MKKALSWHRDREVPRKTVTLAAAVLIPICVRLQVCDPV